jgi:hypothetical protein
MKDHEAEGARVEVSALIERQLLTRFPRAAPQERVMIGCAAALAADLYVLDRVKMPDLTYRRIDIMAQLALPLAGLLCRLGPPEVDGTFAEILLGKALVAGQEMLAVRPVEGHA